MPCLLEDFVDLFSGRRKDHQQTYDHLQFAGSHASSLPSIARAKIYVIRCKQLLYVYYYALPVSSSGWKLCLKLVFRSWRRTREIEAVVGKSGHDRAWCVSERRCHGNLSVCLSPSYYCVETASFIKRLSSHSSLIVVQPSLCLSFVNWMSRGAWHMAIARMWFCVIEMLHWLWSKSGDSAFWYPEPII